MIEEERVRELNAKPLRDEKFVLYWMQSAQRVEFNPALEFAVEKANERRKRLLVLFVLVDNFPEANARHYHFMLEGIQEVKEKLKSQGIKFSVRKGKPGECVVKAARNADAVIADEGCLKIQRLWRNNVAKRLGCRMYEVTSNLIVPIEQVSGKQEYSAATFRKKITPRLNKYLKKLSHRKVKKNSLNMRFDGLDLSDIDKIIDSLSVNKNISKVKYFKGGTREAKSKLRDFLKNRLDDYADRKNEPAANYVSGLSGYLHFGQISPLFVALEARKHGGKGVGTFLEELIVRRELSYNFVYYNENYDNYKGLPLWCRRTLNYHASDKREYVYTAEQLENLQTYDKYWNAAQKQMMITGKMHGYMRMYWGKKLLEWTKKPKDGIKIALSLNNRYELDGRDPNGYAGVLWCFGLHDHPWKERKIFGKVRYMNAKGLQRKFDMNAYLKKVEKL